jgi:hypothetical protein
MASKPQVNYHLRILPRPTLGVDNLTPRGPNLDLFVRKVNEDGEPLWDVSGEKELHEFTDYPDFAGDTNVETMLERRPSLKALDNSTILVKVCWNNKVDYCSGVLLSPTAALTCRHVFGELVDDAEVYVCRTMDGPTYPATRVDVPPHVARLTHQYGKRCMDSNAVGWDEDHLDYQFLQLKESMELKESLEIEDEIGWDVFDPIVACGFPRSLIGVDPTELFPNDFTSKVKSLPEPRQAQVYQILKLDRFEALGPKVNCFGVVNWPPDLRRGSYATTTCSTTNGISGGPIVSLKDPSKLIGISVACYDGGNGSIFLSVQEASILEMYKQLVKK